MTAKAKALTEIIIAIDLSDGATGAMAELMYRTDKAGRRRILRSVYECGVFQTLRDKLRCKGIWVHGALKWRNPTTTCPRTTRSAAWKTTPSSASRWTLGRSGLFRPVWSTVDIP